MFVWVRVCTIGLMFQKELILIKQMHQNNICFAIIGILEILVINLNPAFVMVVLTFQ